MVFQKMEKWSGCQGLKMVGGVGNRREVDVLIKGHMKDPCGNVQYLPCGGGHVSLYTRACTFTREYWENWNKVEELSQGQYLGSDVASGKSEQRAPKISLCYLLQW